MEYVFRPVVSWPAKQANFCWYFRQTEAKAREREAQVACEGKKKTLKKIALVRKYFFKLFRRSNMNAPQLFFKNNMAAAASCALNAAIRKALRLFPNVPLLFPPLKPIDIYMKLSTTHP